MATKVKPTRLQVTGTPQAGDVPMYVDADSFQRGTGGGGGGGNVKSFTLSSTSDLTTAQDAYDWYDSGKVAIIIYNDKEYLFDYATAGNAYWSVANEESFDTASATGMRRAALQLALSSGTVTAITTLNISINDLNVLRTNKDYGTPYTPQYDGSPATKKYVDDNVVQKGSTAPSSPTEGMLWYDTTNDQLKVYDGTNWNVTGEEYNAGEGIEFGTIQDYSAMQGPAPDGFHVPSIDEWTAVKTVWTTLGGGSSDGTNFGIALKLPLAGSRSCYSSSIGRQDSYGLYWSSSRANSNNAYRLYFGSTDFTLNAEERAYGFSVRCFKDSQVIPDNTWTKLYGTSIEAGGIFWSSSLGLISMSSNGTTWITIADKNLGATTVWNSGDTLSEANCGKYYQWGNNYGFAWTGTLTDTSTTRVDASVYGPGNYYSSSTFIVYSGRWDTTDNANLRGGVTGVITINNAITNTGVLSVNGQTGDVTISGGDVQVSSQSGNILTSGMKIWAGLETDYTNLGTYDSNTVYLII